MDSVPIIKLIRSSVKNKSGSAAEDLILDIPKGTVIYDEISNDELLDCCDEGSCDCKLNSTDTYELGWAGQKRIQKMRHFREKVLRYSAKNFSNFDYYLTYDFDLQGGLYLDGLITSFSKNNWDMIFARGLQSMPQITKKKLIL